MMPLGLTVSHNRYRAHLQVLRAPHPYGSSHTGAGAVRVYRTLVLLPPLPFGSGSVALTVLTVNLYAVRAASLAFDAGPFATAYAESECFALLSQHSSVFSPVLLVRITANPFGRAVRLLVE